MRLHQEEQLKDWLIFIKAGIILPQIVVIRAYISVELSFWKVNEEASDLRSEAYGSTLGIAVYIQPLK